MSIVLHRGITGPELNRRECSLEPPEFECADTCTPCEDECEDTCAVKTRARDSVALQEAEGNRCFSLHGRGCNPKQLPAFMHCIAMKVRRKGSCKVLTTEVPYKAKYDGSVCFNWTKRFKSLPDGYYEGDVYINGKTCYTWPFHIQGCYMSMQTEDIGTCEDHKTPCDIPCGCATPPLEPEIDTTEADGCEECKTC